LYPYEPRNGTIALLQASRRCDLEIAKTTHHKRKSRHRRRASKRTYKRLLEMGRGYGRMTLMAKHCARAAGTPDMYAMKTAALQHVQMMNGTLDILHSVLMRYHMGNKVMRKPSKSF
jgi:hypothetical protein